MKAILFVSHGSRVAETQSEIENMLQRFKKQAPDAIWERAYLEVNQPDIRAGIRRCVELGASSIIVVTNFLNVGRHVLKDIPEQVSMVQKEFPQIKMAITKHLSTHPDLGRLYWDLIREAEKTGET